MTESSKVIKVGLTERAKLACQILSPQTKLEHFKNVTNSVMQDALKVWAELWAEFEGSVTSGVMVQCDPQNGFKPSCGWPEFLEKMWLLRHYLDFARRFCEQNT